MKQSGLGDNLYVDGVNLSGDTGSIGAIGGGPQALELTGIDKSAFERGGGIIDGRLEWSAWFNPSNAHPHLSQLPLGDRLCTYCRGTTLGAPAASLQAKQLNYDPERGNDGSLTITVQAQANGFGVDWGELLTPGIREDTEPTEGPGVDFGPGTPEFGLQAWLHVFELDGTDVTVTLEHSDDDGDQDPYTAITGATFEEVTAAPAAQRIATARDLPVKRYIRAVTSGDFSVVRLAVAVTRNQVAVRF